MQGKLPGWKAGDMPAQGPGGGQHHSGQQQQQQQLETAGDGLQGASTAMVGQAADGRAGATSAAAPGQQPGLQSQQVQGGARDVVSGQGLPPATHSPGAVQAQEQPGLEQGSEAATPAPNPFDDLLWFFALQHRQVHQAALQRLEQHKAQQHVPQQGQAQPGQGQCQQEEEQRAGGGGEAEGLQLAQEGTDEEDQPVKRQRTG